MALAQGRFLELTDAMLEASDSLCDRLDQLSLGGFGKFRIKKLGRMESHVDG